MLSQIHQIIMNFRDEMKRKKAGNPAL